jgi:hypothetical protein
VIAITRPDPLLAGSLEIRLQAACGVGFPDNGSRLLQDAIMVASVGFVISTDDGVRVDANPDALWFG